MGHRGLMIDALVSVRLITADGKILTASREENHELFWGIRGAGSNFGIITSATFRVWGITNNGLAMSAGLVFPASVNGSYWRALQTFDDDMPARLALTNMAFFDRQTNQVSIHNTLGDLIPDIIDSHISFSMPYTLDQGRRASHI